MPNNCLRYKNSTIIPLRSKYPRIFFLKAMTSFRFSQSFCPICFIYFSRRSSWCQKGSSQVLVHQFLCTCVKQGKKAAPTRRPGHLQQGLTFSAILPIDLAYRWSPATGDCDLLLEILVCLKQSMASFWLPSSLPLGCQYVCALLFLRGIRWLIIPDVIRRSDVKGRSGPALYSQGFAGDSLSCLDHRQNSL